MSFFRRNPRTQPATPAPPVAPQQAAPGATDDIADLNQVMDVLLDDMVVAQRTPPNPPPAQNIPGTPPAQPQNPAPLPMQNRAAPAAPAASSAAAAPAAALAAPPPSAQPRSAPSTPSTPAAPVAPPQPNVGPQLLPAPNPAWNGAQNPAQNPAPPPSARNGQRPPMPPAPVGVSTVPPVAPPPLPTISSQGQPLPPAQPAQQLPPAQPRPQGLPPAPQQTAPQTQQPHALRTPGDPYAVPLSLDPNAVAIRGRGDGVAIEVGAGQWDELLNLLSHRLESAGAALRSTRIELELGGRPLTEADLDALRSVMAAYGMEPALVRTSAERTFMAAVALGIAAQQTTVDGMMVGEAQRGITVDSSLGYYIFRGSLRSGQQLHRNEHVLIIGDVNPGAEVVSAGDILVWGRLRGIAHAGARGNAGAVICALDMEPVQLRIDRVIGAANAGAAQNGPRWGGVRSATRRPELARLIAGQLAVQEWDDTRATGPVLKRRKS